MDQGLLRQVLAFELAIVALSLVALVGHATYDAARRRWAGPRMARAERAVRCVLAGTAVQPDDLRDLARLPVRAQIAVFSEPSTSLRGVQRQQLRRLAADAGLMGQAQRWCASGRWFKRLRGARVLTLLGGGEASMVPLFDDERPEVRAQAAQWAADHPEPEVVERLLVMLDDPHSLCRFTVQDSLLRIGLPAAPGLLHHLSDADVTPSSETLRIAAGIADARFLKPALTHCQAPEGRLRAQAAMLAAAIGGAGAAAALTQMLEDDDADVRAAAATGLGRLAHWPAGGALAKCLQDRSWDVRRGAALALSACGAPGMLLLRRALLDPDPFARDMARQILETHDHRARPPVREGAAIAGARVR